MDKEGIDNEYRKQINYDNIIDKAYELFLEDISTTDEVE